MAEVTRRTAATMLGGVLLAGPSWAGPWRGARIWRLAGTGRAGFSGDGGKATAAHLNGPAGIAVDRLGNVLIADLKNNAIRHVNAASGQITTLAGTATAGFDGDDGPATSAALNRPQSVAADRFGNIYIADTGNGRIRCVDRHGTIRTFAGGGHQDPRRVDGPALAAQLSRPNSVVVGDAGDVFFSDYGHDIVCAVTPDGALRRMAGTGVAGDAGDGGPAREARLNGVTALGYDADIPLYLCDSRNRVIRKVVVGTISTVVKGLSGSPHARDIMGEHLPHGVDVDSSGNIYVADSAAHRLVVARNGQLETIAGNGKPGRVVKNGTPALEAAIDVHGVRRLPGDELVFNDYRHNVVYRLTPS